MLLRTSNYRAFDIAGATIVNNELYISLQTKDSLTLNKGDVLSVIDRKDGRLMGLFEVTDPQNGQNYALATSGVDPLWKGYILQVGQVTMFPNLAAIYLPQGEK